MLNRLREARATSGFTLETASERLYFIDPHCYRTLTTLSRHERGQAKVDAEMMVAYSKLYGRPVTYLFPELDHEQELAEALGWLRRWGGEE